MTSELAQAIRNYAKRPSDIREMTVASLVRGGHLTPSEYRWLKWAIEPHVKGCGQ